MVAANAAAPPSSRSSRATAVTTAWARPHAGDGFGDAGGLARVGRLGVAGVDEAEAARPGAARAVDHERGRAVGPALGEVRAAGLLAHRDEVEGAQRAAQVRAGGGPMVTLARSHSGLRSASGRADGGVDAGARRRAAGRRTDAARLPDAPPPGPAVAAPGRAPLAVKAARSSGATRQATSARSTSAAPPPRGGPGGDGVDRLAHGGGDPLRGERRDGVLGDAARDDVAEHGQVGSRRSGRSRAATGPSTSRTPIAAILRGRPSSTPTHTPG